MTASEHLLRDTAVSRMLDISVATLRQWRFQKRGPRFVKFGAAVRYRPEDIAAWLDRRPVGGEEIGAGKEVLS
jgi:predicted DNA-binding transcriptional regulator AlpA